MRKSNRAPTKYFSVDRSTTFSTDYARSRSSGSRGELYFKFSHGGSRCKESHSDSFNLSAAQEDREWFITPDLLPVLCLPRLLDRFLHGHNLGRARCYRRIGSRWQRRRRHGRYCQSLPWGSGSSVLIQGARNRMTSRRLDSTSRL